MISMKNLALGGLMATSAALGGVAIKNHQDMNQLSEQNQRLQSEVDETKQMFEENPEMKLTAGIWYANRMNSILDKGDRNLKGISELVNDLWKQYETQDINQ